MSSLETIWKPHVTVASIIEEAGKFLFVEERIRGKLVLNQPAGHLEAGESLVDAVIRETLEETGRTIEPEALVNVYRMHLRQQDKTYLRFNFTGHIIHHDAQRELDTGIERAVWMSHEELIAAGERHRSPLVLQSIEDYLQGTRYPLDIFADFEYSSGD